MIDGFHKVIEKEDMVLLKPNYNSADPPPASTDPEFLRALVDLLCENGAGEVIVGESSMQGMSTREIVTKAGAFRRLRGSKAELAFFDEGNCFTVGIGGRYLKSVSLAEKTFGANKIVYTCCVKTHFRADFSASLKLIFGFIEESERIAFALDN